MGTTGWAMVVGAAGKAEGVSSGAVEGGLGTGAKVEASMGEVVCGGCTLVGMAGAMTVTLTGGNEPRDTMGVGFETTVTATTR